MEGFFEDGFELFVEVTPGAFISAEDLLETLFEYNLRNTVCTLVLKLAMQVEFDFVSDLTTCHCEDAHACVLLFHYWDVSHEAWLVSLLKDTCVW